MATRLMAATEFADARHAQAAAEQRERIRQAKESGGFLDLVHTMLDVAGMVPGIGNVADALNALLYTAEGVVTGDSGKFLAAGASLTSAIPGVGQAATAARLTAKAAKRGRAGASLSRTADAVASAARSADAGAAATRAGRAAREGAEPSQPRRSASSRAAAPKAEPGAKPRAPPTPDSAPPRDGPSTGPRSRFRRGGWISLAAPDRGT